MLGDTVIVNLDSMRVTVCSVAEVCLECWYHDPHITIVYTYGLVPQMPQLQAALYWVQVVDDFNQQTLTEIAGFDIADLKIVTDLATLGPSLSPTRTPTLLPTRGPTLEPSRPPTHIYYTRAPFTWLPTSASPTAVF